MSSLSSNPGLTGVTPPLIAAGSPGTAQGLVTQVLNTQAATQPQAGTAQLTTLIGLLSTLMVSALGGQQARPAATPAPAPGKPAAGAAAGATGRPLKIAEIDDFSVAHGNEIAKTLSKDGDVNVEKLDISGGNRLGNMSKALDGLIERVRNGETIDAINISQQDFGNSALAAEVRRKIDIISDLGVPVAVAAGNSGPGQKNALTGTRSFNVASTTNGKVNKDSGVGNVSAEGQTTSFATANLSVQLARMRAQGLSVGQMFSQLA